MPPPTPRADSSSIAPGHAQVSWSPEGHLAAWDLVTVGPGAIVNVSLGGQGLPVVGRVVLAPEVASAAGESPAIDITIFPPPPSVSGAVQVVDELFRQYQAFLRTEHGKRRSRDHIPVDAEGRFRVEGLPPGRYVIQVRVRRSGAAVGGGKLAGFSSGSFDVASPQNAKGRDLIDLGTLNPLAIKD
jgi:hypothetical protein